jgi:hypothetical protein
MKKIILALLLSSNLAVAQTVSPVSIGGGGGGGSGTVTSVSVTSANGVTGTVTNPTTTPAISLTLGAITPTTVNGNTLTTGTGTLTLGAGKTATINNTLTLSGTDGSTLNVGTGGTLGSNAFTSTAYAPLASPTFTGTITFPVTGSTQCLHVNTSGVLSGTGSDCGSGGGGGLTIGTTTITSGTTAFVEFNNAGVLGEYAITGTGNVVMSASPTLTGTIGAAAETLSGNLGLASASGVSWNSDTSLNRAGVATLALSDGATASEFYAYNTVDTVTGPTNYERAVFGFKDVANILTIGTQKGGTGATRNIEILAGGSSVADYGASNVNKWTMANLVISSSLQVSGNTPAGMVFSGLNGGFELRNGGTILTSTANGTWSLGGADAAAPAAQTIAPQSVVAGNTNVAGATFTIAGSKSNGSGGGDVVIQTTLSSAASGTQNALATAVTFKAGNQQSNFAGIINPANSFTPTAGSGAASVSGNDQSFVITVGTAQTSITANFGHTWTAAPICTISSNSTASVVDITTTTTTAITLGASVALTGSLINVLCFGG